jgi:tRNA modification GTPase
MPQPHDIDTIVAIATATGAGGVGIVRLSGPASRVIAESLCGRRLRARHAHHVRFSGDDGAIIDDGIALSFPAPASFTGEDVVELQAHGSPAVLHELVRLCCAQGARHARPGEFSERAFVNGKLDLAQAEAVADLIAAADLQAAQAARRSLDGEFSRRVDAIAAALLALRVHVEAMIDFVDEPIETLGGDEVAARLGAAAAALDALLADAERGRRLRDGLHVVIVGPPNAGKSSLLNALARSDRAIVTDIAGTTRDLLQETVRVGGIELTLVDTAGLREGGDAIEREGMRRAQAELQRADLALVVLDARDPEAGIVALGEAMPAPERRILVHNKADRLAAGGREEGAAGEGAAEALPVSARTGAGLAQLEARLHAWMGGGAAGAGAFTARQRHVDALGRAAAELAQGRRALGEGALDLAAEALRLAHEALGEVTGRVRPDDLLGHIFSRFCIGK